MNPSFLLGLLVLLYLSSFVVFAIIRIATGISIQRIGYFSLRRIVYTPKEGIRIDLRALGFRLHRPTFAQPTWISLQLDELRVTVDFAALAAATSVTANAAAAKDTAESTPPPKTQRTSSASTTSPKPILRRKLSDPSRSRTWKRLTSIKERLKKLHDKIHWLRLVDVFARNSTLAITNVGHFELSTFILVVDTRRKTVDRGRLFQHKKVPEGDQRPAEWMLTVKSVLFTPEGKESLEIIDIATLNVHGLLYKDRPGLRDTSIALKLGRIQVPYDDLAGIDHSVREIYDEAVENSAADASGDDISFTEVIEELDHPGTREAKIVQTVSDSKEFISSILRGIQEVQVAVSFMGMTKAIRPANPKSSPLYLYVSVNEFGIDMHRLDPKSPAHRMYFSPKDIAHQALLAGISIAVSLDDGSRNPEKLLYIPMATTTIKTTLPSKTVAFSEDRNAAERNANILFANFVVTSPSVDLDPKHMQPVLKLFNNRYTSPTHSTSRKMASRGVISRLLPKANIKVSFHEPVIRITLPPADRKLGEDDFDLLISTVSSVSLDIDSSHSAAGDLHYSLTSTLRLSSNQLYYQTALGDRYNLLLVDALELRLQVNASPEVTVVANANLQTFSVHMVRPEISDGVRQVIQQLRQRDLRIARPKPSSKPAGYDFLRPLPPWLVQCSVQASSFGIEVAGKDTEVSNDTRGLSLQLESWTAEYKLKRDAPQERVSSMRHKSQKASNATPSEPSIVVTPPAGSHDTSISATNGRRLAVHIRGLEGFVVEGIDETETESFLSLPRFEVAFSTSSDHEGPIFHVNSFMKALYIEYSLYRYYAIGVATTVIRKALALDVRRVRLPSDASMDEPDSPASPQKPSPHFQPPGKPELISIDLKSDLIQVKAQMPSDPAMMLHIFGLESGQHRWQKPFFRSRLVRIYAQAAQLPSAWARILTAKTLRIDLRESKRKRAGLVTEEKTFDVATDLIRLAVPHSLVLHRIFDNIVNVTKATKQLHHRFKTGNNDSVLKKHAEGPRLIPRIALRSRVLLFDIEDSPFEWKLGMIYRIGLIEQKQRAARQSAFEAKVKHMDKHANQDASRRRQRNAQSQPPPSAEAQRSRSLDADRCESPPGTARGRSASPRSHRSRRMRYNPDGRCALSKDSAVGADVAKYRLQKYNAQSWKRRIDGAYRTCHQGMRQIRGIFWGGEEFPLEDSDEQILALPERPGLMSMLISDLHVVVDKPSFPINDYPLFLERIGKGMPRDMEYSLLIPTNVEINMGEARITLRDYPLPMLHVPAIRPGQSPRLPSWSLKSDFVIAEEFKSDASLRYAKVQVVPPDKLSGSAGNNGFGIEVIRTVSPLKTYSDVKIDINTSGSTSITWGPSLQPAIQDAMMVIESFTKPHVDPSDRVGFWDKIRFSVHSRVSVNWTGDGDIHLNLKGSRDPYVVTGHGAGFVMVWRRNVKWNIHREDDPKKFMTVDAGEYVLGVPDFSRQARDGNHSVGTEADSMTSSSSLKNSVQFKKTMMKLSGDVRWLAGLVFERNKDDGGRSFEFKPHYGVTLRTAQMVQQLNEKGYDAFKGFRSNHIHLSLAVVAPLNREWVSENPEPSLSYNSIHLTPKLFTHFFDWWGLFSGAMSLPVRQGKLFPGPEKSSKKFGRHLGTIKYNILLSPLFITHLYKHKDVEEYAEDCMSATGLKLRLSSFMLDLHQRREQSPALGKGKARQIKTSSMKINQVQLDFVAADLRAISAKILGTAKEYIQRASDSELASLQQPETNADFSKFSIPDNDLSWIDMDDFTELDWLLPSESNPQTDILPVAYSPRFTYFRQTDHGDPDDPRNQRSSPFGDEPTHFCIMSNANDPRRVQSQLIRKRLELFDEQIENHRRAIGEEDLLMVREPHNKSMHSERKELLANQLRELIEKKYYLDKMQTRLEFSVKHNKPWIEGADDGRNEAFDDGEWPDEQHPPSEDGSADAQPGDFNNRFVVHNMQLKWNNSLRNVILRYVHQVSQRRGFVYYLTRRAVKFILDIVEEQNKSKHKSSETGSYSSAQGSRTPTEFSETDNDDDSIVEDRIQDLLNDRKRFVDANDTREPVGIQRTRTDSVNLGHEISENFTPLNSYDVRLIAPQIQLQSNKNAKSILLVTAKSMQLQVVQIMDKGRMADDVSGLVQRRFSVDMDSIQFFVTSQKMLRQFPEIYLGNPYGNPANSSWPPWVPMEVNFDFSFNPLGWSRVVSRTSASLRYDKYNTLRLKYNDDISGGNVSKRQQHESSESRIDHIWVNFPHVRAICDSTQYFTMYVIVLDLLLYSEPLEKVRSERLEKIMLASDFSDLRGAPEMVMNLQGRVRQLEELKNHFQIHKKYLDRQGWLDNQAIEQDLANCEDELFFMMKAITTSQRRVDDRFETAQGSALLQWNLSASEIVWHLMKQKSEPLMEIQLSNALYNRTDNTDGSNLNTMEIDSIHGLNLLPNALFPEMLGPYFESGRKFVDGQDPKMLKIHWHSLEAIAGIPVLDQVEIDLFPLKIQLEREAGQKLFEYIFPNASAKKGKKDDSGTFSPLNARHLPSGDEDEGSDDEHDDVVMDGKDTNPSITINTANGDAHSSRHPGPDLRIRPTMHYPDKDGLTSSVTAAKHKASNSAGDRHFKFFQHSNASSRSTPSQAKISRNTSATSLADLAAGATSSGKAPKRLTKAKPSEPEATTERDKPPSDDLSLMLSRASSYMTLAYVRVPSVVLCLSYKGKGERNIEDVHDFVFRMPLLEYRNKTWSNLDLALRLKKDIIRALISHTGAIIGNKLSHHRPTKQQKQQQQLLRNKVSGTSLVANTNDTLSSDFASTRNGRISISGTSTVTTSSHSELSRTSSFASSLHREQGFLRSGRSSDPNSIPESDADTSPHDNRAASVGKSNGHPPMTFKQTLARRLTGDASPSHAHPQHGEDDDEEKEKVKPGSTSASGSGEDADESHHKKSVRLLLGKKILGQLN